jgi:hypothetical protein
MRCHVCECHSKPCLSFSFDVCIGHRWSQRLWSQALQHLQHRIHCGDPGQVQPGIFLVRYSFACCFPGCIVIACHYCRNMHGEFRFDCCIVALVASESSSSSKSSRTTCPRRVSPKSVPPTKKTSHASPSSQIWQSSACKSWMLTPSPCSHVVSTTLPVCCAGYCAVACCVSVCLSVEGCSMFAHLL